MSFPSPGPGRWPTPGPPAPAPLHLPQYDATLRQAASRFWRKYTDFSGRASRSEYWWWSLIAFVVNAVLQVVATAATGGALAAQPSDLRALLVPLVPSGIWFVVTVVPSVALTVRRLHDTNRRGWWYLLVLPSLLGSVLVLTAVFSSDLGRLADGDAGALALAPLISGFVLLLVGAVGSIILLVFLIFGPDPRGVRFDRQG